MASETVDPIDWSPPTLMGSTPELHVLHSVNTANKSQDLLHQPGLEHASTGMPDQRTTCAATQGINLIFIWTNQLYDTFKVFFLYYI